MKHEPSTDETSPEVSGNVKAECRSHAVKLRIAAITLACLPFVLLEIGLRLFSSPAAVSEAIDNDPLVDLHQLRPLFVLDKSADQWVIPPGRYNFFRPASFSAIKAPHTRRIFVLGGSTTQGRPYSTETAFSTWLQLRLQAASPEWSYEVVNCGGVSYASYRVAKILKEALEHQPDAIVLYTGHNEFLEDRTYAEVRQYSWARRTASRIGNHSKIIQWLKKQVAIVPTQSTVDSEVNARLDHAGGLESYQRDPQWRNAVEAHFESKLAEMIQAVRAAGIPLVLCVPASEIVNTPPIKTQLALDLSELDKSNFQQAMEIASDDSADATKRIAAAKTCLEIDADHAGAQFILGRLLYNYGNAKSARPHLIAARDWDVCPLRATTPIVAAVRDAGTQAGVFLVDTESLLDRRDPSGKLIPDQIPDPNQFVDHLHPSIAAHQAIAAEIAQLLNETLWKPTQIDANSRYETLAREHLQSLDESYYARGKQRLEGLHRWATGRAGQLGTGE
ncbi:MAG: SGNH/GDSL hydrolase family protein [Pirellulaceae bacterium]